MENTSLPLYLQAADNHNWGNGRTSWLDPETWTAKLGNAGKFMQASVLAGTNSIYSSAVSMGNFLGADIAETNTNTFISGFDADLAKYYRENQESVELGGFILGAIIPGLGGIKILHAGQAAIKTAQTTGFLGGNIGKAAGLLTPRTEMYVKAAIQEMNASTTTLKLLNANTSRALASGLWQNTLEAAAFETVVQVTMFKSPILEQQDGSDIAWNIALGGVIGGVIGGVFGAASIRGRLKAGGQVETVARFPWISRPAFFEVASPSERIVQLAWDTEAAAIPVSFKSVEGTIINNFDVTTALYKDKVRKNFDDIRIAIHGTANGDTTLGNMVANLATPVLKADGKGFAADFSQNYLETFSGLKQIMRPIEESPLELAMRTALAKGEVPTVPVASRWFKLLGEDAGNVIAEPPKLWSLGDVHKGEKAVKQYIRESMSFSAKLDGTDRWSVLTLSGVKAHTEAEARYIWAATMLKEVPAGAIIDKYDFPLLQRAYKDGQLDISIHFGKGPDLEVIKISSSEELFNLIKEGKENAAAYLGQRQQVGKKIGIPFEQGTEAIAKITDVRQTYLEGIAAPNIVDDIFAMNSAKVTYLAQLKARGLSTEIDEVIDPVFLPKYAKVLYEENKNILDVTPAIVDAITYFKMAQKEYEQGAKRVVSKILGKYSEMLPDITDKGMLTASRTEEGAGLFSSGNANYGSLGSVTQTIGSVSRAAKASFKKQIGEDMESSLVSLGAKQEAAFEFESINQKISRSPDNFVLRKDVNGVDIAVTEKVAKQFDTVNGPGLVVLDNLIPTADYIDIIHPETLQALKAHVDASGARTTSFKEIRAQQGKPDFKNPEIIRPIRPDLKIFQHFAFVIDTKVTGSGHVAMIHAASEKDLAALIQRVPAGRGYKILVKVESEEYRIARVEYEYSRALNENYINSDIASKGVFSNFFPKSDPQRIIDDILQQHYRESDILITETVRLRYEPQFSALENFGKQYSKIETSKFGANIDKLEKTANNPYFNYIKTALDISKINEYPLIFSANKLLDEAVSKTTGAIRDTFLTKVKSPQDLALINTQLDQFGMKPAFYDADMQALVNHTAPKGLLTKFVREANSILSLFTLGLDQLNALNNAIGSNILRSTELKHLMRAIKQGDERVAGELANIAKIKLPGVEDEIISPSKLIGRAIKAFWEDQLGSGSLIAKYKSMGLIKDHVEQLKLLVDDFTLKGTETVADLKKRTKLGFARAKALLEEKGPKVTGNKLAEEFNRFISANVMDQLTAIAISKGLMDNKTALAYINTFVNRVEGNLISSQRPLIFQGPIGQAISLFQAYQFNLLQQLFRYVSEGAKKDVALLAGLQGTLYGLQSLPAFQFMNVHILGQMSGNKEHRDMYDGVYGIAGRTAGNFILYGLPSNILHTNIYSRGDINPRQLTVLPTSLQEIPIVQGWGKFLLNIKDTLGKAAGGAPLWETILQGIEHNGISRPLAGFAQTLQALGPEGRPYSTSSKGSILYSNDLMSLATMSRMAGGRPLDEAIINDGLFRVKVYQSARQKDMQSLAEEVKLSLIQGNEPTEAAVEKFITKYTALGGKQAGFNKWMMELYKNANVPQAEQLQNSLTTPFSYKMQLLMGGEDDE